jgi:hypothetical protein
MNTFLNKYPATKKFSSIVLLFILVLGITPKKTLHTWFANHKDSTLTIPEGKTQQLTKAGFTCNCEDLVCESHFITFGSYVVVNIPSVRSFVASIPPSLFSLSLCQRNLRGPPLKF